MYNLNVCKWSGFTSVIYAINSECLLGLRLCTKCFTENQEEKKWLCPQEAYNLAPLSLILIPISGADQPIITVSRRTIKRNVSMSLIA